MASGTTAPPALLPNPPAADSFDLSVAVAGKTPSVDSNADGTLDGISVDTNGDGILDALAIDSNGDTSFDRLVRDLDGDNVYEAVVEMTAPPPTPMMTAPCRLEFSVKTEDYGGKYGNKNSGAIWVTKADGTHIRTFEVWAQRRAHHLHHWVDGTGEDRVDAVSGATLLEQKLHVVTWDCKAKDGTVLPYGAYLIHTEFTSVAGQGPYLQTPFERGPQPVEVTSAPIKGLPMGATLKYQPQ
jgi:hypothetical protein